MLTKRPLLGTAADRMLFVFDPSRDRARRSAFQRRNTLIVGEPGSGKTSLLHQILANAAESSTPLALLVDARLAANARELVDLIVDEAERAGWIGHGERPSREDPFALASQIRRLRAAAEGSIILIDDPDPGQAATLFGRLRDELWQLPLWFTAAVGMPAATALSQPPADAFFDHVVTLEPLDPDLAVEMLERREHQGSLGRPIARPTRPLQPRAVMLDAEGGAGGTRSDDEFLDRLTRLALAETGRPGAALLAEIWGRGAVSASDESLQRNLGVTRARLTQLLTELERAGALTSFRSTTPGAVGRPRTLYDLNRET